MSLLDDSIDDDELLAAYGQYESRAPPPTHAAAASHSASSGAASSVQSRSGASAFAASTSSGSGPTPAANSFNAAFASFTNSAMYVPLAQMPMPAPATTSAASAARAGAPASASAATIARPTPPKATSAHSILVSPRQKGNPLLVHISNVAWSFGEKSLVCDYEIGETTCALYLSLKYHMLHGGYLQSRLTAVKQQYTARVILVYVDVEDSEKSLMDISRLAFAFSWTVVCCWSPEEMARYLETFKLYEKKTSEAIQERVDESDLRSKLVESLTMVRSINKTDVANMVHRLHHVMNQPFITSQATRRLDDTTDLMTPAQITALHAANVAKAQVAAAAAASQRKGAIHYVDAVPTAAATRPHATAAAAVAAVASSSARAVSISTVEPTSALPTPTPASDKDTLVAAAAAATAIRTPAASIATTPASQHEQPTPTPPSFDPMDFVS